MPALAKPNPYPPGFTRRAGDSAKSLRVEAPPLSLPPCALKRSDPDPPDRVGVASYLSAARALGL